MRRPRLAPLLALLFAAGSALLPSCGYSTRRLVEMGGARTVCVLPFENTGFRRDLELRLTQAVANEIRARTDLALASEASADLILSGSMAAGVSVLSQRDDRSVAFERLSGTADVTVLDRRTGVVVKKFQAYAERSFPPDRFGETLEGSATDEWVRRLAERIVQGLESGW